MATRRTATALAEFQQRVGGTFRAEEKAHDFLTGNFHEQEDSLDCRGNFSAARFSPRSAHAAADENGRGRYDGSIDRACAATAIRLAARRKSCSAEVKTFVIFSPLVLLRST